MKNCNMILTEKQQKYHLYHQVKLMNMNICRGRNTTFCSKNSDRTAKFAYYPLRKALEKQAKTIKDKEKKQQIKAIENHEK